MNNVTPSSLFQVSRLYRNGLQSSFPIKTILIIEDDQDISLALSQVLKDETRSQVIVITDGFVAQKVIRTVQPDLFVVDYHLPGMDGLELVDTLRATPECSLVPILFISARPPKSELAERQLTYLKFSVIEQCKLTHLQLSLPTRIRYHFGGDLGSYLDVTFASPLQRVFL